MVSNFLHTTSFSQSRLLPHFGVLKNLFSTNFWFMVFTSLTLKIKIVFMHISEFLLRNVFAIFLKSLAWCV